MAVDKPVITSDEDRSSSTIPAVSMLDPTVDPTLAIIDENQSNNLAHNTSLSVMKALISKSTMHSPLSNTSKNAAKSSTPSGLFNLSDRMCKHFMSPAVNPSPACSSPTPSNGLAHTQNLDPSRAQTSPMHSHKLTREEKLQRIGYKHIALSSQLPTPSIPSALPKLVEDLSKNPKLVPKVVSDKLLALESEITVLQEGHEAVLIWNRKLERDLCELTTKWETTQQHNDIVKERLASFETHLMAQEARQVTALIGADEKVKVKNDSAKDNVFNVSACLWIAK